ncbi:hypothetical protein [Kiritimatiella glycovorans]|uniref:Glycosyl hydrolase family 67 n=1 Tax=Kiritimatiella glycovorans TaxID=1307763 RepID=A0A0G3EHZ1_9BACT|nr:hypothetical protein [Kiritimatiella glycovorans]AKJ65047.1 hypothetical protein L21SP4_01810 [Kiritimatiella glycovorans]
MNWTIIDGIGPFFTCDRRKRINWSKAPFEILEHSGLPDPRRLAAVEAAFRTFARRVAEEGFNTVTLDDLAHLADLPGYPPALRRRLAGWRAFYRRLFRIAASHELRVLITTDVVFEPPGYKPRPGRGPRRAAAFLGRACDAVLREFPEVAGMIFRLGEADADEVRHEFRSRLALRTPGQARRFLKRMLPVFERNERWMIVRTWTVGAHFIGDLIWNPDTFDRVFAGLDSGRLIISMKYGESDFFRFLPLNPLFFHSNHRKIVELQARREYEGFGEYPSFTGWDYERYASELVGAVNVEGLSVWCQTGGWSGFRRLTYLDDSALWAEVNANTALRIFRDNISADRAVQLFYKQRFGDVHWGPFRELLQLSDEVIRDLLYIDDFATRNIFFRRLRVPPLFAVYWDRILINHPVRKLMRCFVRRGEEKVRQGYIALEKIERMIELAEQLGLPSDDLRFQYDTFRIIAAAREYYFRPFTAEIRDRIEQLKKDYKRRWPKPRYKVHTDFSRFALKRSRMKAILKIMLRRRSGYRRLDRLFTLRVLLLLYPLVARLVPKFMRREAMGLYSVFR